MGRADWHALIATPTLSFSLPAEVRAALSAPNGRWLGYGLHIAAAACLSRDHRLEVG